MGKILASSLLLSLFVLVAFTSASDKCIYISAYIFSAWPYLFFFTLILNLCFPFSVREKQRQIFSCEN